MSDMVVFDGDQQGSGRMRRRAGAKFRDTR